MLRPRSRIVLFTLALTAFAGAACYSGAAPSSGRPTARPTLASSATGDLALVLEQRLVTQTSDGSERELFRGETSNVYPASPRWAPDGGSVAFVRKTLPDGRPGTNWGDDIYIMQANGGGVPQLVRAHGHTGQAVHGLAWTPDGTALLFGDLDPVFVNGAIDSYHARVARIDLGTGAVTTVVESASDPSLSRDGRRLAYRIGASSNGGVGIADADGGNAHAVLQSGFFESLLFPRISPDGNVVVFSASGRYGLVPPPRTRDLVARVLGVLAPTRVDAHGLPMDVWRVEVATGTPTQLTHLVEDDPCAAWSADGATLLVIATGGLYEVQADGSGVQRLGPGVFGGELDRRQ